MVGTAQTAAARPDILTISGLEIGVNSDGCGVDDLSFCGAVTATVPAEVVWDEFVAAAVAQQWVGVEALSGLPGTVGDVVAQGSTAYGQRVEDVVASVRTWDEVTDHQKTFPAVDCEFRCGGSRFSDTDRYRILDVTFLMRQGDVTRPLRDPGLLALLRAERGARVPLRQVREALLAGSVGVLDEAEQVPVRVDESADPQA